MDTYIKHCLIRTSNSVLRKMALQAKLEADVEHRYFGGNRSTSIARGQDSGGEHSYRQDPRLSVVRGLGLTPLDKLGECCRRLQQLQALECGGGERPCCTASAATTGLAKSTRYAAGIAPGSERNGRRRLQAGMERRILKQWQSKQLSDCKECTSSMRWIRKAAMRPRGLRYRYTLAEGHKRALKSEAGWAASWQSRGVSGKGRNADELQADADQPADSQPV